MKRFDSEEGALKVLDVMYIGIELKTKNVNTYIESPCFNML